MFDVLIVGAGVVGSAVARELSRYQLKIGVIERGEDVCSGTSKANSAIIHGGFDAAEGSLKARFNVEGNRMMSRLADELDIPFRRNGAMVVAFSEEEMPKLTELMERGIRNGAEGLRILSGDEARAMEPALSEKVCGALLCESSGIVCPFEMTQALAENACVNGVEFYLSTCAEQIKPIDGGYRVETDCGAFDCRAVVNCAGLYSDVFHNQICSDRLKIIPRRGEYMLMDRKAGTLVDKTIFQAPGRMGKGVLITPTVHGNLMIGPTAEDISDPGDTATTVSGLEKLVQTAKISSNALPMGQVITSFAGLRAHLDGDMHDFQIGEAAPGYFEAVGVESPGLSAAPAIGKYLSGMIAGALGAEKKADFNPVRRVVRPREMDFEARQALIAENPAYGNIICRCEQVSEGEILDAIHRPLGARSLDAVKRRTRAGMGRCQSGFCMPKVSEILRRELGTDVITKRGGASHTTVDKEG